MFIIAKQTRARTIGALLAALSLQMAISTSCVDSSRPQDTSPPHVVIIMADDLGWQDLGFTGCKDIPTPHLDRLASQGVIFDDAHVSASVCAPSRTGFTLGRYQQREGCEGNGRAGQGLPMEDVRTFPGLMKVAGYETVCIGKWHMGQEEGRHPMKQGYEHFSGFLGGSRSYRPIQKTSQAHALQRDWFPVDESEVDYLTDWLTQEACARIRARDEKRPMMLVINYNAPHTPMHARKDDLERFAHIEDKRRRTYAAMVWRMDQGIGEVLDELDKQDMSENTMVVFFSDNGGATTNASDNGPWRGMKGSKWEGGHRVPFVIRWPGHLPARHFAHPIVTFDLLPTCLAAAGKPAPTWTDGVNLLPYLRGSIASAPHETLYWRRMVAAAVRDGSWKLVRIEQEDAQGYDWHLIDLRNNPEETRDVLSSNRDVFERLKAGMDKWESQMQAPLWREGKRWERNQRFKHRMDTLGRVMERRFP